MKRPCKSSNPANSGSRNRWRDLLLRTSRGDRTAIELFSGQFSSWTKSLIAIAQALATRRRKTAIRQRPGSIAADDFPARFCTPAGIGACRSPHVNHQAVSARRVESSFSSAAGSMGFRHSNVHACHETALHDRFANNAPVVVLNYRSGSDSLPG